MTGGGESACRSIPSRSMSAIRRSALHDRSSTSRKNWPPVMMVARQASWRTRLGQRSPPKRAAQSSQPSGTMWVWTSMRTAPRLLSGPGYHPALDRRGRLSRDVRFLATVVIDGALTGSLYALVAVAFVVVYRASRMINFALGEWAMLGSRLAAAGMLAGLGLVGGVAGAAIVMVALGTLFSHLVLRRLLGQPLIALIMVTLGLGALVRGAVPVALSAVPGGPRLLLPDDP